MAEVKSETWRGPYLMVYPDGRRVAMERDVVSVSDIRDTAIGPVDFGYVRLMGWRYVELERKPVDAPEVKALRRWWKFW